MLINAAPSASAMKALGELKQVFAQALAQIEVGLTNHGALRKVITP